MLALLLDAFLLHRQLFDAVCDLIANSCEISADLLVVLQDLEVLSDGLEKGLSELSYFICVDDAALEQFFGLIDEDAVSVVVEWLSEGTFENFEVYFVREVSFEGGEFESDRIIFAEML